MSSSRSMPIRSAVISAATPVSGLLTEAAWKRVFVSTGFRDAVSAKPNPAAQAMR